MRKLYRDRDSGEFLRSDGQWTRDGGMACDFLHNEQVELQEHARGLRHVEWLYSFEEREYDFTVGIPEANATAQTPEGRRAAYVNITQAITAEHATFVSMFLQIELLLPSMKSKAEVSTVAAVVEGLLADHAQLETMFAFEALDHAMGEKGRLGTMRREHREMDGRLRAVRRAGTCSQARRLLRGAMRASVRHFRDEERNVLPLIAHTLKPEHLAALGQAFAKVREGGESPREEQALGG